MGTIIQNGIKYGEGKDGFSPVVNTREIENGYRVDIRDVHGNHTFDILNGKNGLSEGKVYTSLNELVLTADATVQGWFADAPVVEPEYCTDFGTSTRSGNDRCLNSFSFSDGANGGTVTVNQSASYGAQVYFDKTDVEISLESGKEITSDINWTGYWMNTYFYVDFNNDGEFTKELDNFVPTEDSELLAYSFWSGIDGTSSDGSGYNSTGDAVTGDLRNTTVLPSFTIPAGIAEGTYRARLKISWNTIGACDINSYGDAPCVVDFMLTVTAPDGIESADADAVQVYAADGVIYINGYEGNVKVVNVAGQVVKDVNVNGNETLEMAAGLYMVITGDQVTKVVVK